jgi:hypothetical protein
MSPIKLAAVLSLAMLPSQSSSDGPFFERFLPIFIAVYFYSSKVLACTVFRELPAVPVVVVTTGWKSSMAYWFGGGYETRRLRGLQAWGRTLMARGASHSSVRQNFAAAA